jgi:hypothetical protein
MISKNMTAFAAAVAVAWLLLASIGSAEDAAPLRKGSWPIRDGRNYQPTERDLRAMNRQDITPDEAREVDRLYDELMANSEKPRKRYRISKH